MIWKIWLARALVIFGVGVTNLVIFIINIKPKIARMIEKIGYLVVFPYMFWSEQKYLSIVLYVLSSILILCGFIEKREGVKKWVNTHCLLLN